MSIFKIIDIDTILLKLLLVDDLRNLYRINRYYRNLIKPLLADYIYFYSNTKHIDFFDMNDDLFLESVKYGRIHVCKYNYVKFTPTTIYAGLSSSEIITQTILEYGLKKHVNMDIMILQNGYMKNAEF